MPPSALTSSICRRCTNGGEGGSIVCGSHHELHSFRALGSAIRSSFEHSPPTHSVRRQGIGSFSGSAPFIRFQAPRHLVVFRHRQALAVHCHGWACHGLLPSKRPWQQASPSPHVCCHHIAIALMAVAIGNRRLPMANFARLHKTRLDQRGVKGAITHDGAT